MFSSPQLPIGPTASGKMNLEPENSPPNPDRRGHATNSHQHPPGTSCALGEEKLEKWVTMLAEGPDAAHDLGLIARAEARLSDPDYPNDEILEAVAMNILLREES